VALSEANAQRKLIGGDINSAPLGGAASRLAEYGLTESIELRLGDGADVLRDGEVECLVMAGIGGRTMANILNRRDLSKLGVADLVLQPNRHEPELRIALANKGWEIQEEEVVLEGVKAYVVMHWQFKGEVADYDTMDYWLGPKLKRNRGPLCLAMVDYWCLHYGAIVNAKEGSGEDIQALKEGLASLRKWLALSLP